MADINEREYWGNVPHGISSPGLRGIVAGGLGAPVEGVNVLLNLLKAGYGTARGAMGAKAEDLPELVNEPRGGYEWFGKKGQELGLWDDTRNPVIEGGAGLLAGKVAPNAPQQIVQGLREAGSAAKKGLGNAATAAAIATRNELGPIAGVERRAKAPAAARVKTKPEEPLDVRTIEDAREPTPQAPYIQTSATSGELPLFDLSPDKLHPQDVAQADLQRQRGRGGKNTDRMQALLDSPTARRHVDTLIQKGRDIDPRLEDWYGTLPLREAFGNENAGLQEWPRFMGHMSSTSQRNPVDQQNKMGSLMWMMDKQSLFNPDTRLLTNAMRKAGDTEGPLIELPTGYGSLAQGDIFNRSKRLAMGEDPMEVLPEDRKLGTFLRNLMGNYKPVTVDVNAVKGPAIMSRDPRWLETKVVDKDDTGKVLATHTPRADVMEGRMSMKDAQDRPGFWIAAPEGSEYGGFEDLYQRAAKRHGITPAGGQALAWYGSADVGALKTKPEMYLQNLERMVRQRADATGQRPAQVLAQFLRGKEHLAVGGVGAGAGASAMMGDEQPAD
jgi:hypothetical protein